MNLDLLVCVARGVIRIAYMVLTLLLALRNALVGKPARLSVR